MKDRDIKNEVERLKEQRNALVVSLADEKRRVADLQKAVKEQTDRIIGLEKKLSEKLLEAERKERAVNARYAVKLNELKFFSDRVERLVSSNAPITEKSRLIDLFKGFLDNIDKEKDLSGVADEVAKRLDKGEKEEEFAFDLEEAVNPKGELDLKKLCEELGVYQG